MYLNFHFYLKYQNLKEKFALLSQFKYAIWINRNLKKHENKNVTPYNLIFQFLNKIKFRILIDRSRLSIESFINRWCKSDLFFCKLDITNNVVFADTLDINNHFKPQKSYVSKLSNSVYM